jgi:pimeloyl-ACP methyl ester carboxylesterase
MKTTSCVIGAIFAFSLLGFGQAGTSGFFTASDGVKIHYLTAGDSGSWVVLIHGYTDSARRMWFTTGIAPALAKNHRVVALDNRNHGESDKPQPNGTGRTMDVIELMDHLKIQKAHIHGYSMGGGMTGQLLGIAPQRFITAGFGGAGINETDPELRSKAASMDEKLPKAEGADAAAMNRFRTRVASARPTTAAAPNTPPVALNAAAPAVELSKLRIPIIAINGAFDNPYSKTHRLWREAITFQNVILPGKTHLTAIAVGGPMPQQYIEATVKFIDSYDELQ